MNTRNPILVSVATLAVALTFGVSLPTFGAPEHGITSPEAADAIRRDGRARVIVKLKTPSTVRGEIGMARGALLRQRSDIASVQRRLRGHLRGTDHTIKREFKSVPYVALNVDAAGLARLEAARTDVEGIYLDHLFEPLLAESVPQMEGDLTLAAGLDGSGSAVVIVDTGVDGAHPFLAGKVVHEACFAVNDDGVTGACPNGQTSQIGSGAAAPCTYDPNSCFHGTHVAGIAAGSDGNSTGVAPGADVIAIQVFHPSVFCGTTCALAFTSDIAAALEHVYDIRDQYSIAAVNLSLGGGVYTSACDADFPQLLAVMDNLKAAGIATVVASGNGAYIDGISSPACVSTAISVGAVDESDTVAWFSNVSQDLDLFAPGTSVVSSMPGGTFASYSGTSMATPHVAGAWAVLEQVDPTASVDDNLAFLELTGRPITDNRGSTGITKPRVRLGGAAGIENPAPVLTSVAPSSINAWGPDTTLTITGSGFVPSSVVFVDGVATNTTYVSDTVLTTTLSANDLATSATSISVHVFSPPLGGGTSGSLTLLVAQPSLSVNTTAALPGDSITVTLDNVPGRANDWLAFAVVGAANNDYLEWTYVPTGSPTFSWTVTGPQTLGQYEFRLFSDDTSIRITTSPAVTVQSPVPVVTSVSPSRVLGFGPDVTLTVAGADFIPTSQVLVNGTARTTAYGGSTTLTATIPASDLATAATSLDISVYSPPLGGGTSNSVPLSLAHPVLTLSSTSVDPGGSLTVMLDDALGGTNDWLALAGVNDPNSSYLQWTYVASGATTATWNLTMPTTPGDYEIRYFAADGFTRLGTSGTVTVGSDPGDPPPPPPPPTDPPSLAVSATSVAPGEVMTVTLSDGPGNQYDWIALAGVNDGDRTYLQWVYVAPGATTATWTLTMPTAPGDYEFRLFEDNGFTRLATSETVTVASAPPPPPPPPPPPADPPSLAVSATSVDPGEVMTVTLSDGPGNQYDWIALAGVNDGDRTYLQWVYVEPGATTATWTLTMPTTPGDYEFRLFEDNGFTRLATSETVTVASAPPPPPPPPPPAEASLEVSANSVISGDAVTVTLTDGPGNQNDWLALAGVGDSNSTYLQWVYVEPGATTATWTVTMPATPGDYEFRLFEDNTYTRLATSETVTVSAAPPPPPPPPGPEPTLEVSETAVTGGATVTVTMTDGPGNANDWLALAGVGYANTSYLDFIYVSPGATTATWTVTMPATPGDYEIRLFEDNGYNRLATSPTIVVSP